MRAIVLAAGLALAACAVVPRTPPATKDAVKAPAVTRTPKPVPPKSSLRPLPVTPVPSKPVVRTANVVAGPDIALLPFDAQASIRALAAFRLSCPALLRRTDATGFTRNEDWRAACEAASSWPDGDATEFFTSQFETVQVEAGTAFATGYFEPEIAGSRVRDPAYPVPVYGKPGDLIDVDLGLFSDTLKGKTIRGRVSGTAFVPYYDRAAIESGALAGHAPEIAWVADPIDFFFLQVQGSGRLRLPGGSIMRIGYAGQNGRDYTGIGALMRDRGLLGPGQQSMQGIVAWLRAHPDEGRAIMRENKSWVFFSETVGPGPKGALGVAVTPQTTVAADPAFVPLGAPVWLSLDRPEATGLWVAQDTGGAIKGANRFDTFWGAGDAAKRIAGGMSGRGTAYVLLPKGSLRRLMVDSAPAQR